MRVAVVNDLRLAAEALRRVVCSIPGSEIAWMAADGQEAVEKCASDTPDLILMDLVMPVMDGAKATQEIMRATPCPILVTTATISGNCALVYDALGAGAVDAVETPELGIDGDLRGAEPLVKKISCVRRLSQREVGCPQQSTTATGDKPHQGDVQIPRLVAIGASTGGPVAICQVLKGLRRPADFSVVIVQHLDVGYVPGLGEWLSKESGWPVSLIEHGMSPVAGHAYLAHTSDHLVFDESGQFRYTPQPGELLHRPSIDVFFSSLHNFTATQGVAALLTGMGRDGATGLKHLREANWVTIAQDEQSSVVWGMPAVAVRENAARHVLPLDKIGQTISDLMSSPHS